MTAAANQCLQQSRAFPLTSPLRKWKMHERWCQGDGTWSKQRQPTAQRFTDSSGNSAVEGKMSSSGISSCWKIPHILYDLNLLHKNDSVLTVQYILLLKLVVWQHIFLNWLDLMKNKTSLTSLPAPPPPLFSLVPTCLLFLLPGTNTANVRSASHCLNESLLWPEIGNARSANVRTW